MKTTLLSLWAGSRHHDTSRCVASEAHCSFVEATAKVLTKDGWLNSEDLGYVDSEGSLFVKGRGVSGFATIFLSAVLPCVL